MQDTCMCSCRAATYCRRACTRALVSVDRLTVSPIPYPMLMCWHASPTCHLHTLYGTPHMAPPYPAAGELLDDDARRRCGNQGNRLWPVALLQGEGQHQGLCS
eukprot:364228-Chlamydomonas_euryale.AAC.16